jgi:hypothetical protein
VGSPALAGDDRLITVFENGLIRKEYDLEGIRERAEVGEAAA